MRQNPTGGHPRLRTFGTKRSFRRRLAGPGWEPGGEALFSCMKQQHSVVVPCETIWILMANGPRGFFWFWNSGRSSFPTIRDPLFRADPQAGAIPPTMMPLIFLNHLVPRGNIAPVSIGMTMRVRICTLQGQVLVSGFFWQKKRATEGRLSLAEAGKPDPRAHRNGWETVDGRNGN